jgi:hypothetical protein
MKNISIRRLRQIIREEIGRNYHTINNDPYSWQDHEGIDVEIYPSQGGYYAQVTVTFNDDLSTPLKLFPTEDEAVMFSRKSVETALSSKMSEL